MNTCLYAIGVDISSLCPLCHQEPETIIHALHDCMVVKPIWNQLGRGQSDQAFYGSELPEWLEINGKESHTYPSNQIPWRYVFLLAIWIIWLKRNQLIFQNKGTHSTAVVEIKKRAMEYFLCKLGPIPTSGSANMLVRWERPGQGKLKLNMDG